MKLLHKVILVQFFLYERQVIEIEAVTGIFGANGAGKSAFLDAVQTAMFGGSSGYAALNAQADEGHASRSIRGYCLGQYGPAATDRVRDSATTYITLVWRDTETEETVSTGVCIAASSDREKHTVLGRYILRSAELSLSDHLVSEDGEERPIEWDAFRHRLLERAKVTGDECTYSDIARYIRDLMLALRGNSSAASYEAFIRAFRFGLRMRFDKSVDQIVRNDVLEHKRTDVKRFRETMESFRKLDALVKSVEKKISDGNKVNDDFLKAEKEEGTSATWGYLKQRASVLIVEEALKAVLQQRADAAHSLSEKTAQQATLLERIEDAKEKALQFRLARESHAAHKDFGAIQTEIQTAKGQLENRSKELFGSVRLILNTMNESVRSGLLPDGLSRELKQAIFNAESWLPQLPGAQKEEVLAQVKPCLKAMDPVFNILVQNQMGLNAEERQLEVELQGIVGNLERVRQGRPPLHPDVDRLARELQGRGLNPIPVCDLVKIGESDWQPVIESYLGMNAQALLVPEDEEGMAFSIYRRVSKDLYNVKLIQESKQRVGTVYPPGSVAELIVSDSKAQGNTEAAVAYLRRQFSDLMRADSDSEALSGRRTLTKDGMLCSNGAFEKLRRTSVGDYRIGAGSADQAALLLERKGQVEGSLEVCKTNKAKLDGLLKQVQLVSPATTVIKTIEGWLTDIAQLMVTLDAKAKQMESLSDAEYAALGQQETHWESTSKTLGEEEKPLLKEIGGLQVTLEGLSQREAATRDALVSARALMDTAATMPIVDHVLAASHWSDISVQFSDDGRAIEAHCESQRASANRRMTFATNQGMSNLGTFLVTHGEQGDGSGDWLLAKVWLRDLLLRLESTSLVEYREEMAEAYRISQDTFRHDVAMVLNRNLLDLDRVMERLNATLKACPLFTNGERYQFMWTLRPQFAGLHRFIQDIADIGPTRDLLGDAGDIPQEFRDLMEGEDDGSRSPLNDHREFFEFDVEIQQVDLITGKSKSIGRLSERVGNASGGEHRAPLYVIAGAALHSAYHLDKNGQTGARLILLDEAFNKMDFNNIVATMRYLEDLQLQIVLASPGENRGVLTAFLHCYYDIVKDPTVQQVLLTKHSVSEHARLMFREDLPEFNPELLAEELAAVRSESLAPSKVEGTV